MHLDSRHLASPTCYTPLPVTGFTRSYADAFRTEDKLDALTVNYLPVFRNPPIDLPSFVSYSPSLLIFIFVFLPACHPILDIVKLTRCPSVVLILGRFAPFVLPFSSSVLVANCSLFFLHRGMCRGFIPCATLHICHPGVKVVLSLPHTYCFVLSEAVGPSVLASSLRRVSYSPWIWGGAESEVGSRFRTPTKLGTWPLPDHPSFLSDLSWIELRPYVHLPSPSHLMWWKYRKDIPT